MLSSHDLQKWRKLNQYYYKDLEHLYRFLVQTDSRVLEVSLGIGFLLDKMQPKYGLEVTINSDAVELAKNQSPDLEFCTQEIDRFTNINPSQNFDYVLLANTISYIEDIPGVLRATHKICRTSTRIIITFHNPAWQQALNLATLMGQRMPSPPINWLGYEDVRNLLNLCNFETIFHGKRMLIPKPIPIVSWFCNRVLAHLPILNSLCLTEYIVARIYPSKLEAQRNIWDMTCSVIIPARNEAGNIEDCISRMPRLGKHTEIIFIEGHSSDRTWEEIQRVSTKYSEDLDIKCYQQKGKGKGDAVRLGFETATNDVLIILDADLTVKPEDLTLFFEAIASGYCELANGCRLVYPVRDAAMPWLNRLANRFFAWLLSYLLNTKIKDSLCGTKAISRVNYLKLAKNRLYFGDFDPFGDFDLLLGAVKLGLKIKDIPIRYMPRAYGSSNIQHVKEGWNLLKMCLYAARKIKFI
jgi:Glycosyl transferase family 2/Methionine biosynthesis protein MetW